MNFSDALNAVKQGDKIYRSGWNGKNQFVILLSEQISNLPGTYNTAKCLALKNAQDIMQPGWVPSQGDLFTDDWQII